MCHDYNVDKAVVGLPVHHVHLRYMYVSNLTEVCQLTSNNQEFETTFSVTFAPGTIVTLIKSIKSSLRV